ncbi:DUF3137 domain-containing protein [Hyphomonas sp.]|uniref:DUF3137 domain-containing protein n=1 Tax=Hyphomonas sp. TaxID=87 RepID=UPI003919C17A
MAKSWDEIEQTEGFAGARALSAREVEPVLARVVPASADPKAQMKNLSAFMIVPFFLFGATFMLIDAYLPDSGAWIFLQFFLFPVLFIFYMGAGLFLARNKIAAVFAEAQVRLGLKAEAVRAMARPLGLSFVPAPGGAPKGLEWIAKQSWAPAVLREAEKTLNEAGGMNDAVAVVRDSGLLIAANVHVVGTPEQKKLYAEQAAGMMQLEDGFQGTRRGIRFEMFEWVEKVDEAPDVYHLVVVLEAPLRLHGVTQLRSRKTGWPAHPGEPALQDVDLGPKAFDALYRLRASDQVEARALFNPAVIERVIELAHGGKFRAVARGGHLVFDFESAANRFQIVDLLSGVWSDETIRATYTDIAEALALVDTLAHAFMVARKSDTGGA